MEYAVRAFLADDKLVAATGHLIIDPYLVNTVDKKGNILTINLPAHPQTVNVFPAISCCLPVYRVSDRVPGRSEGIVDSMFTLSGAVAVYRRSIFQRLGGYRGRTVSEDTDMTFLLQQVPGKRVGYLPNMRVHLAPVLSWAGLYSQRTRWQRGALNHGCTYDRLSRFHNKRFLENRLALASPNWTYTCALFTLGLDIDDLYDAVIRLFVGHYWFGAGTADGVYIIAQHGSYMTILYLQLAAGKSVYRIISAISHSFSAPQYILILGAYECLDANIDRGYNMDGTKDPLLQKQENGNMQRDLGRLVASFLALFSLGYLC